MFRRVIHTQTCKGSIQVASSGMIRRNSIGHHQSILPFQRLRNSYSTAAALATPETNFSNSSASAEAKYTAFSSRIGVNFTDFNGLEKALTHQSFPAVGKEEGPDQGMGDGRYNMIGKKVLDLFTSQYVMSKYPKLPAPVCTTIVQAYIGQEPLASVGKSCGIQFVARWKMSGQATSAANKDKALLLGPPSVRSWAMESLVGFIYKVQGAEAAKKFIMTHILSRSVDAERHFDTYIKMNRPRQTLAKLLKTLSKPAPVARLLKETGRQSHAPIFIVGIYSGFEKIGESYGSSLKMAENRAVRDALLRHYGEELKSMKMPNIELPEETLTFFEEVPATTTSEK